jgi:nicotinate-nucleotide adenylyltransferase
MRVGLFGGTFDPVHLGHLILAEQCREQGRLDQVWFLPSAHPPHKSQDHLTRFEQRVEMLQLAVAGHEAFRIEEIEKELPAPGYTVKTAVALRQRHPHDDFFLLVGGDSLKDLPGWREPDRLAELVGLLVLPRPGYPTPPEEQLRRTMPKLRLLVVEEPPLVSIASSDLRARVVAGRSIRYLVPRAVEVYIREKGLYRAPDASGS